MKHTSAMATNNACNNDVGAAQPQSPLRPQIAFFEFAVFNVLTGQMFQFPFESHISMSQASGVCSLDPLKQSWRCCNIGVSQHFNELLKIMMNVNVAVGCVDREITSYLGRCFCWSRNEGATLVWNSFHFVARNCSPRVAPVWNRKGHTNGIQMAYKVK